MKKKLIVGILCLVMGLSAVGCGNGNSKTSGGANLSAQQIAEAMLVQREDPDNPMEQLSQKQIEMLYSVTEDLVSDSSVYAGENNMKCDELAVFVPVEGQEDHVLELVEGHLDTQRNSFAGYAPDEAAVLENASVKKKGKFVVYVAGSDSKEMMEIFEENTK